MPISEVTMWRATCDACGMDDGGEHWAWADDGYAIAAWEDAEDIALPDGRLFHQDCLPADVCPDYVWNYRHVPADDYPTECENCERTIPVEAPK